MRDRSRDAHASVLLREGVARLLEDEGFDVVAQTGSAEDLMLKVRSYTPDVAIVDIRRPPTHTDEGLRAPQEIREKHPEIRAERIWENIVKKLLQKEYKFDAGFFGSLNEYVRKIAFFFHASYEIGPPRRIEAVKVGLDFRP